MTIDTTRLLRILIDGGLSKRAAIALVGALSTDLPDPIEPSKRRASGTGGSTGGGGGGGGGTVTDGSYTATYQGSY